MKKNLIIGLLTIVSLLSLTYGYFQKVRADEQEALAIENAEIARAAENRAMESQKIAEEQRILAMHETAIAYQALAEARSSK
jgi:hypothetical protein